MRAVVCAVSSLFWMVLATPGWAAQTLAPGVPNFHKVNDFLFRGGQPSQEGFAALAKLGVKTVIDLRRPTEHAVNDEERMVKALGMKYLNFPMEAIVAPDQQHVAKILEIFGTKEPVFVHCKEGKDRTGTVIACYRMS